MDMNSFKHIVKRKLGATQFLYFVAKKKISRRDIRSVEKTIKGASHAVGMHLLLMDHTSRIISAKAEFCSTKQYFLRKKGGMRKLLRSKNSCI